MPRLVRATTGADVLVVDADRVCWGCCWRCCRNAARDLQTTGTKPGQRTKLTQRARHAVGQANCYARGLDSASS
jgi:hypothetical protein